LEGELVKNSPTLGRDARYQKTVSKQILINVFILLLWNLMHSCYIPSAFQVVESAIEL